MAAHAIVKNLANNDSDRFVSIDARFAKPVYPGGRFRPFFFIYKGCPDCNKYVAIRAIFISAFSGSPFYVFYELADSLETHMWKVGGAPTGYEHVIFVTKVKERDVVVISNGLVVLKKEAKTKL